MQWEVPPSGAVLGRKVIERSVSAVLSIEVPSSTAPATTTVEVEATGRMEVEIVHTPGVSAG